ncbi:ChrR family anti-sigma-E factor [Reyranella sp.]|uniref:ChrR family anti-sigma-E factor n=1 Tax=Reyranella sp. TaxID=1929291 RepID=UPI001228178F|nr:ChrR family anti-sigma-E factor [Reyranella sp.]TAJ90413.1 MAG: transcriptional regulator [Reyranella sp.]
MTIKHHPSDDLLLRLTAGSLGAGPALVITTHLEGCEVCRRQVAAFESVGGAILEGMSPEPLKTDALARTLERLDLEPPAPTAGSPVFRQRRIDGLELPSSLHHCAIGSWRWLAPGFRWSKVAIPGHPDARVVLLKGAAGSMLPAHGHSGPEFLQVLSGAFSDERGRYGPGDLDEADTDIDHRPVVDPESECICLAALEGETRPHGGLARLLWPLIGF